MKIDGNIRVLDYLVKAEIIIDSSYLTFSTKNDAYPFNGIFKAQISTQVDINHLRDIVSNAPTVLNVSLNDATSEY